MTRLRTPPGQEVLSELLDMRRRLAALERTTGSRLEARIGDLERVKPACLVPWNYSTAYSTGTFSRAQVSATATFNIGGMLEGGDITAPMAGLYVVCASIGMDSSTLDGIVIYGSGSIGSLSQNTATSMPTGVGPASRIGQGIAGVVSLTEGQMIHSNNAGNGNGVSWLHQGTGANQPITRGTISAAWLGPSS